MTLIQFDDSVTAANLPADQKYGVFYVDGEYANETEVRARLPHAILAGITAVAPGKTGKTVAFCDCELYDLTVPQTEAWVIEQIRLGVGLIGPYANLATWAGGLYEALGKYEGRIKRWAAAYDQDPSLTLTYEGKSYTFDAHQWAGGVTFSVDKNVADPGFFTPWKPPAPPDPYHYLFFDPTEIKDLPYPSSNPAHNNERWVVENYDKLRLHPGVNAGPLLAVRQNLAFLATRAKNNLAKDGPGNHLEYRIAQLEERANDVQVVK